MKTILTVVAMLTVAPLVAATTLVCWAPYRFGGSVSVLAIPAIALFGVFTVPLWFTYIPALVLTPMAMKRIAQFRSFVSVPLPVLVSLSLLIGAPAGVCVMIPFLLLSLPSDSGLASMWAAAGGVSGAITLTVITLIHRWADLSAEPDSAANGSQPIRSETNQTSSAAGSRR